MKFRNLNLIEQDRNKIKTFIQNLLHVSNDIVTSFKKRNVVD